MKLLDKSPIIEEFLCFLTIGLATMLAVKIKSPHLIEGFCFFLSFLLYKKILTDNSTYCIIMMLLEEIKRPKSSK